MSEQQSDLDRIATMGLNGSFGETLNGLSHPEIEAIRLRFREHSAWTCDDLNNDRLESAENELQQALDRAK